MRKVPIPFTGRGELLAAPTNPRVVQDGAYRSQAVWPIAKDIPTELIVAMADDHVHAVECAYPQEIEATNIYYLSSGHGFFRTCAERGVLTAFGIRAEPVVSPYDDLLATLERAHDCLRCQPDDKPFKWMGIFSAEIVLHEWHKAETHLRHLFAGAKNPFR